MNERYDSSDYLFPVPSVCDCGAWDEWDVDRGTKRGSDGGIEWKLQYATCQACGRRKKILWEVRRAEIDPSAVAIIRE